MATEKSAPGADGGHEGADLGALSDLCTPWCLHVVATLRIADHFAAGSTGIGDLAQSAGCDSYALRSVSRVRPGLR